MIEVLEEEDERIERLCHSVTYLKDLHEDVSFLEHALIEGGNDYRPYEPTFFLYVFFSFNTLYNIDWEKSRKTGIQESAEGSEENKIKGLIHFCFSEDSFPKSFSSSFRDIVTMRANGDVNKILRTMESIIVDGVNVKKSDKGNCKAAFKSLLTEELSEKEMKTLATFIYKVRCNIVHGTKSFDDLRKPAQRERIVYYSFFLIALQHMLFMYLEYLNNGFFESASEEFVERLRSKRWLSESQ